MADHIESVLEDEPAGFTSKEDALQKIRADWECGIHGYPSLRNQFFQRIAVRAVDILQEQTPRLYKLRIHQDILPLWTRELYELLVKSARTRLARVLSKIGFSRFFFSFDECGYLNQGVDMSLAALMQVIKVADHFSAEEHGVTFWHLMLDTSLGVFELAPRSEDELCERLKIFKVLPAWPYMSFDIRAPDPSVRIEQIKTPRHALHISFLKRYGRPVSMFPKPCLQSLISSLSFGNRCRIATFPLWYQASCFAGCSTRTTFITYSRHSPNDSS